MSKPNILLILTDQHHLDAMSCYGAPVCRTPHLDALAADGVLFRNAYTTTPVCSPARASVATGLFPHGHGMTANTGEISCAVHNLRDKPTLISRRLQEAGYRSGYTGKWHLGTYGRDYGRTLYGDEDIPALPRDHGYEGHQIHGHAGPGSTNPEYLAWLVAKGFKREDILVGVDEGWRTHWWPRRKEWAFAKPCVQRSGLFGDMCGELAGPAESGIPHFLVDHSIDLVDRYRGSDEPWFIWHNFWGPHHPCYAPSEYVDLYRDADIPEWPSFRWPGRELPGPHRHTLLRPELTEDDWEPWADALRHYFAFATWIDAEIGRLVDHLKATGQYEDTAIIFSADHGDTWGSHGGCHDKGWLHFEEILRVPFIAKLPGGAHAGTERTEFVGLADIHPTCCTLAGLAPNEERHGESLLGLLDGSVPWRDCAVSEFGGLGGMCASQRSLRTERWKYGFTAPELEELYDLEHDPHELTNLAWQGGHEAELNACRRKLLAWCRETGDPARGFLAHHYRTMGMRLG